MKITKSPDSTTRTEPATLAWLRGYAVERPVRGGYLPTSYGRSVVPWRKLVVMPRYGDSRLPASDALTPGAMGAGIRLCSREADVADATSRDAKKPAFRRGTRIPSTSARRRLGP